MALLMYAVILIAAYYILDWIIHLPKIRNNGDKYIVVTGCDSGFGKLLALRLHQLGFHVFASCLTEDGKNSLSEICSSRLIPTLLDLTNEDSIYDFANFVNRTLPANTGIWALVNNAGILGNIAQIDLLTKEDFSKVFNVNFLGIVEMTRSFLPLIRKSRGRIINMSSVNGRFGFLFTPYTVSKFAVEAFSDMLRREVYHEGIKVSILEPGAFKTDVMNVDRIMQQVQESVEKCEPETKHVYDTHFLDNLRRKFGVYCEFRSEEVHLVIEAYIHALTAKVPRSRYLIGWDGYFFGLVLSSLPDWAADIWLRIFFYILEIAMARLHRMRLKNPNFFRKNTNSVE
ncbi:retinol dehydrogenase 7 [Plakobranchus ocellatus]|uniref:Retinol dehydrogenase 7 n=1 Tax=Plakobranchus ocellatus TaxID=259542 RepID=A0AAV4ASU6_9GAST|nr:retinol dehydrogenase 7 [Plakobranchus ocellatus]